MRRASQRFSKRSIWHYPAYLAVDTVKDGLSQYLFNNRVVNEYLDGIRKGNNPILPQVVIEVFLTTKISHCLRVMAIAKESKSAVSSFELNLILITKVRTRL